MRIAVIGAGNIGRTLGGKWSAAGHAEVVLLAVPAPAAKEVLASLGSDLAGKVVVDATNDVQGSGKLHALDELADGAHPVRAFNTLGWETSPTRWSAA